MLAARHHVQFWKTDHPSHLHRAQCENDHLAGSDADGTATLTFAADQQLKSFEGE
jgi:hypothetical protein